MSLFSYVGTPNTNLICCICRAPFTDPTTTRTCSHTFCSECIRRALAHSPLCPVDRSELTLNDLFPANPIVRSLVDELQVECVHRPEGCMHTCQRQMLAAHLKDVCEYSDVLCSEPGCNHKAKRKDLPPHIVKEHLSSKEAKDIAEQDPHSKNDVSPSMQQEDKVQSAKCPHNIFGCPYSGPLQPSEHLASCPYETFKDFLTLTTSRTAVLTEQNLILKSKVDTLEGTLQQLRREMNTVTSVLGPWFRNANAPAAPNANIPAATLGFAGAATAETTPGTRASPIDLPTSPPIHAGTSSAIPTSPETLRSPVRPSSPSSSEAGPSSRVPAQASAGTESFASYFPHSDDVHRRPNTHRSSSNVTLRLSSTASPAVIEPATSFGLPFYAPRPAGTTLLALNSATSLVPTLDTSSSLDQTLGTLREGLVSLAQSLDGLGRRNEMALGNETLRLNEEMMSLRAQMHGLRMQMHGIMLELSSGQGGAGVNMHHPQQPRMVQVQDEDGLVHWVPAPPVLPFGAGMGLGVPPLSQPRPPGIGQSITKL